MKLHYIINTNKNLLNNNLWIILTCLADQRCSSKDDILKIDTLKSFSRSRQIKTPLPFHWELTGVSQDFVLSTVFSISFFTTLQLIHNLQLHFTHPQDRLSCIGHEVFGIICNNVLEKFKFRETELTTMKEFATRLVQNLSLFVGEKTLQLPLWQNSLCSLL